MTNSMANEKEIIGRDSKTKQFYKAEQRKNTTVSEVIDVKINRRIEMN